MNDHNDRVSGKLHDLLARTVALEASDLHLIPGYPPVLRVHGDLLEQDEPPLTAADIDDMLPVLVPPGGHAILAREKHLDGSFGVLLNGTFARFRVNLFQASGQLAACLRSVPMTIPGFEWIGLPADLGSRLAFQMDGLVIVTGATGSGKTTTLAALVQLLNQTGGFRIITVEEPVEYLFPRCPDSVVTQREVGRDVLSFADGLKAGLRQDPDVVLVGEIRDRETAQMALSAAETGHLVFTTLHTRDAKGAISRFADLFPQDVQRDIRYQLAMSLRAVVSQRLLSGPERGTKRHLALEVLWNTNPIGSAIRQGKLESIDNYLLTGRDEGQLSLDESLRVLLRLGKITREVAEQNARDPSVLNR